MGHLGEQRDSAEEVELRDGGVAHQGEGGQGGERVVREGHALRYGDSDGLWDGEGAVLGDADGEQAGHPPLVLDQHVVEVCGDVAEERRPRRRVAVDGRPPSAVELPEAGEVVLHHRLVQEPDLHLQCREQTNKQRI